MDYEVSRPRGYSALQIWLHWLIAGLVVFQIVFGEVMEVAIEALEAGTGVAGDLALGVNLHIWFGVTILILTAVRLIVRLGHGSPPPPAGTPRLQILAADVVHWAFYALLVAVPISGLVAWFVAPEAGDVHKIAKPLLVVLILLHVAGAAYHQFVGKDTVLHRMFMPAK